MLTLFTLGLICLAAVVVIPVVLRIAGAVLLVKAVLDQPVRWENFLPAVAAFALSVVLGWLF